MNQTKNQQAHKSLLLIAHGSRRAAANKEVQALAAELEQLLSEESSHTGTSSQSQWQVQACFLELAEPSIPQALEHAVQKNTEEIWLLPYFLTEGRHVREDIPRIIQEFREKRTEPDVPIHLMDYIGAHQDMSSFLLRLIQATYKRVH